MWPDWSGQTVAVVASGPSAADAALGPGQDRIRFLAVKDGWRLCPWADVLYACDHHWWAAHKGVREFRGTRIAYDRQTVAVWGGLKVEIKKNSRRDDMLFEQTGVIGWGGNSGFQAINLAVQFGAAQLLLVGFDMRVDRGKHFFGTHKYTTEKPSRINVDRWRATLDRHAAILKSRGVEVINCSMVSALTAYPKMTFEEALNAARQVHA